MDVVDAHTRYKKLNTRINAIKQHIKEYQISKCQLKGSEFLHLACQGGGSPPCLPVNNATAVVVVVIKSHRLPDDQCSP